MSKYRNLAVFNGILLGIMIFLNGIPSKKLGLYTNTIIYHILGFMLILIVSMVRKNKLPKLNTKSNENYKQNQIKSLNN